MKKIYLLLSILFLVSDIFPQYPVQRLTTGYLDYNPTFGNKSCVVNDVSRDFLAFERKIGTANAICVLTMSRDSVNGSPVYIVNNTYVNRNPSIDNFSSPYSAYQKSMIVWESNQNGNFDIFYSALTTSGWSTPAAVTTSQQNETNPHIVSVDTSQCLLVFERNNDIIFKRYLGGTWLSDTNLTVSDTNACSEPVVATVPNYNPNIMVIYHRQISPGRKTINYIFKPLNAGNWSQPDTIAYSGDSKLLDFRTGTEPDFGWYIYLIFKSDRLGNWNIYQTLIKMPDNIKSQSDIYVNTATQNHRYAGNKRYGFTNWYSYTFALTRASHDSTFIGFNGFNPPPDYYYGDTSKAFMLSISKLILPDFQFGSYWIVFNKDSLTFSNIFGRKMNWSFVNIKKISSEIPSNFRLSQNYPNPFNPVTRIKFDIPNSVPPLKGDRGMTVSLKIFDLLGRELATLVNEAFHPGTYEIQWDATNFPSGVYFYQLTAGDYSEQKKMVLLK